MTLRSSTSLSVPPPRTADVGNDGVNETASASPAARMDGSSFRRSAPSDSPDPARPASVRAPRAARSTPAAPWEKKSARLAGLSRLGEISKSLAKLHREEVALLKERDALITQLRSEDVSWALLATRTGISRQALSKRAG
ncbi:hypothetical protein GCM10009775_33000 [Microbacterium aoyamense]|uniref:Uncharacterized protein n=1 Tax=Microbacterium aoyamense TaxID=344166 RepID=A0ABP5B9Z9_9MICO